MQNIPLYMRTMPEEFYNEFMIERNEYSQLVEQYYKQDFNIILQLATDYININFPDQAVLWVGGSRSWSMAFECNFRDKEKSSLERNSIIPGNFDVFILSNDKSVHEKVVCFLTYTFETYLAQHKQSHLAEYYQLTKEYGNINVNIRSKKEKCSLIFPTMQENCVLFPCQSLMIHIKSKKAKSHPLYEAQQNKKMDGSTGTMPFADAISVISLDSRDSQNRKSLPLVVKNKLLFYFESFVLPDVQISKIKQHLLSTSCVPNLNLQFLNPLGLLLFSEFIVTPRKEKGLNVDAFRKGLLLRTMQQSGRSPLEAYQAALNVYSDVFGSSKYFDPFLLRELLEKILVSLNFDITKVVEHEFIPRIRPYVNSFLRDFSESLDVMLDGDAFLVLVGGDAMRRYDANISQTSDFDTKIFVHPDYITAKHNSTRGSSKKRAKNKMLESLIVKDMSRFVTFLIEHKHDILRDAIIKEDFISEETYVSINLNVDGNQFRLRYIEKHSELPVDLFSIDFRTIVHIDYYKNRYSIPVDIPFLDVVLTSNEGVQQRDVVNLRTKYGVPVASLDYLLKDLEKTYTTPHLAAARYWNNKKDKDEMRYKTLRAIKSTNENSDMIIDHDLSITDKDENVYMDIDDTVSTNNTNNTNTNSTNNTTTTNITNSTSNTNTTNITNSNNNTNIDENTVDTYANELMWYNMYNEANMAAADKYAQEFEDLLQQERKKYIIKHKSPFNIRESHYLTQENDS